MSMTREMLRRGFLFTDIDEMMYWKDSYHETESFAFAGTAKKLNCDYCGNVIAPGSLYSIGNRQVYPDAPIYGDWVDRVHMGCSTGYDSEADVLSRFGPPNKIPGWGELPEEEKDRLLTVAGLEITPENKAGVSVFAGVFAVVVGEFSQSKEAIGAEIEANGGKVVANVTKSSPVTHIILGAEGVTKYGQKTGKGSKRYKDAMKKKPKPQVVDYGWVQEAIKKGENVMQAAAQQQQGEEKRGTKRKAGEGEGEGEEKEGEKEKGKGKEKKKARTEPEPGSGDSLYDEESLKEMNRRGLQALCKKHSLKANGTNDSLVDQLAKLKKSESN